MALSARLEIRQGQGLVITPQLQQAIKLLQLSNLELEAYVEGELERNPLLARDEGEAEPAPEIADGVGEARAEAALDEVAAGSAQSDLDAAHDDVSPGERATGDGSEAGEAGGAIDWSKAGKGGTFEGDGDGLDGLAAHEKSLAEYLTDQAALLGFTPPQAAVAAVLIDGVDEGGYLRLDLAETAERLGCELALVEGVLTRLQGLEPTGVFARDVAECLRLQLIERDRCDPAMSALLDNLDLLARRDMAGLKRICGVDDEDLRDMLAELRALTPRPGAAFGG
ncbi:MAG: RNA polymerase sigma-54 factor, partial [Phenylobacterium sp.]|nr:RNA polymerase sigma-54 factor [Phenylobacterium sp.]